MKRLLRTLHRWLGLGVGLWAALVGLTGSVLVFSDEIDAWLNPQLLRVEPRAAAWHVDGAVAAVRERFAGEPLLSLRLPRAANEPIVLRVGEQPVTDVYVNPYTSVVLGTRAEHGGAMGFLFDLHAHLLAGETGETVAGVLALVLIVMLVSGLVLWWPRRRQWAAAFKIRWSAAALPRMFNLHRVAGAMAAPLLLIAAVTGAMLVFHNPTTAFLIATLGGPPLSLPKTVPVASAGDMQPVSRLLASAAAALPDADIVSLKFPRQAGEPMVVRLRFESNTHPNGRSFVAVDPRTAEVLHVHDWRQAALGVRASDYKYPLHIGTAFGLPGRIIVLIAGLVPVLLLCTGGYVWWRKRAARRGLRADAYLRDGGGGAEVSR